MNELIAILKEIKNELVEMNERLDSMQGSGLFSSLTDIFSKLDDIAENGLPDLYDAVRDSNEKIDDVKEKIDAVSGSGYCSLSEVCERIDQAAGEKSLSDLYDRIDALGENGNHAIERDQAGYVGSDSHNMMWMLLDKLDAIESSITFLNQDINRDIERRELRDL